MQRHQSRGYCLVVEIPPLKNVFLWTTVHHAMVMYILSKIQLWDMTLISPYSRRLLTPCSYKYAYWLSSPMRNNMRFYLSVAHEARGLATTRPYYANTSRNGTPPLLYKVDQTTNYITCLSGLDGYIFMAQEPNLVKLCLILVNFLLH